MRRGRKVTVKVVVAARGISSPTGRVRITAKAGKRKVATSKALGPGGRTTVKLRFRKTGRYKVRVVYAGTAGILGSTSTRRTVKAVR